ncbi:DUF1326 domain-containing protein [Thalassomonas haliotis]|uniref:DUF1326 domain-containing protein n=1 Tax=Thalassomonas haliotis TaxID=485448 RepID=A0ABY7VGK5_9GAMM|nr:DUF1326 domain-containing protein [Thalassomonas haliotis]WDE12068.1 DUF1326 domain-containing protein [Thalassomonas haliotis]
MTNADKWFLKMHQIECCNTGYGYNGQFVGFPECIDNRCEVLIGFSVIEGRFNDLDLTGLNIIYAAMWPKAIYQGDGIGVFFVDQAAVSEEQLTAIAAIMSGKAGGQPFELLAGTFSALEGPVLKDIDINIDEKYTHFSIRDMIQAQHSPLISPLTGLEQNIYMSYPELSLMGQKSKLANTRLMSINYGRLNFKHNNCFAATTIVNWSN